MTPIDYNKIAQAISFYETKGFKYIEVPWFVSRETIDITRPPHARYFNTFLGQLVASGEQSFLEIRDTLIGRYQCATPCFRDDNFDELHLPYFFKVELIDAQPEDAEYSLNHILHSAINFFEQFNKVDVVKTDIGIDININGVEVGSYGIRRHEDVDFSRRPEFCWVYGTGIALPRLDQALLLGANASS